MNIDHQIGNELNDEWLYRRLSEAKPEEKLDLRNWYRSDKAPRWRGLRESVWTRNSPNDEWRKLLRRLPHYLGSEIVYLNSRLLDIACRMLPHFDTILADHAYHEWLLYAEFDFEQYREHIVHPFKTAVLADWLLNETRKISTVKKHLSEADHIKRMLRHWGLHENVLEEDNFRIINAALWLASLLHDTGYGHYLSCQIHKRIVRSYHFCAVDLVGGSVAGMSSELVERSLILRHLLDESTWKQFADSSTPRNLTKPGPTDKWKVTLFENFSCNHSVAGGLNLLCLLKEIIDFWPDVDPRLAVVFELAAEAIFLHDLTSHLNFISPSSGADRPSDFTPDSFEFRKPRISFTESPLAVILILADELQCWGRPRLVFRQGDSVDETIVEYRSSAKGLRYRRLDSQGSMVTLEVDRKMWEKLDKLSNPEDALPCVGWDGFLDIYPLG